jgi:secretion/DNA translocation related TadE-like protein
LAGVLVVLTGLSVTGGRLLLDHRRAAAAADLAALAAATAVQHGTDACSEADRFARLNRAGLARCTVRGDVVEVEVEVVAQVLLGRRVVLRAEARAGPDLS